MTESYKMESEFQRMRHTEEHHLGLGDIRITIGQQEVIVATMKKLESQNHELEGALQEVRSLLHQAEAAHTRVDAALGKLRL